jgi:hypothetical protein
MLPELQPPVKPEPTEQMLQAAAQPDLAQPSVQHVTSPPHHQHDRGSVAALLDND